MSSKKEKESGSLALHEAIKRGDLSTVKKLLKKSSTVMQNPQTLQLPMHISAAEGKLEVLQYLLEKRKNELDAKDHEGWTPLHCACHSGHLECVELLVNAGANVTLQSANLSLPLHYFVRMAAQTTRPSLYEKLFRIMIQKGVNVNLQNLQGETPLHMAAFRGREKSVSLLLWHTADPNLPNKYGETCLHLASRAGYIGVVNLLLRSNSDLWIRGVNGTAREIAENCGNKEVVRLLDQEEQRRAKEDPAAAAAMAASRAAAEPAPVQSSASDSSTSTLTATQRDEINQQLRAQEQQLEEAKRQLEVQYQQQLAQQQYAAQTQIAPGTGWLPYMNYAGAPGAVGSGAYYTGMVAGGGVPGGAAGSGKYFLPGGMTGSGAVNPAMYSAYQVALQGVPVASPIPTAAYQTPSPPISPAHPSTPPLSSSSEQDAEDRSSRGSSGSIGSIGSAGSAGSTGTQSFSQAKRLELQEKRREAAARRATAGGAVPRAEPKKAGAQPSVLEDYTMGDILGKGAFGSVYKGLDMKTGAMVAIKQVSLTNVNEKELNEIMAEVLLLKRLDHTNIVKYLGIIRTKEFLNFVLEYIEGGSLLSLLKKFGNIREPLAIRYVSQTLEGLDYLHRRGVVHRDIKCANILITKDGIVKLADFGIATMPDGADGEETLKTLRTLRDSRGGGESNKDPVGSPYWMAPEIILMQGAQPASDIWSLACTIIELVTGDPPFANMAPMSALFAVVQNERPPIPDDISEELYDLLLLCLQKDPARRPTARQLLEHPWITGEALESFGDDGSASTTTTTTTTTSAANGNHNNNGAGQNWALEAPVDVSAHDEFGHVDDEDLKKLLRDTKECMDWLESAAQKGQRLERLKENLCEKMELLKADYRLEDAARDVRRRANALLHRCNIGGSGADYDSCDE